jgi:hypothetical protein
MATKERLLTYFLIKHNGVQLIKTVILNSQLAQSPTEKFTTSKISDVSSAVLGLDLPRKNSLPENTCDIASQCPHISIM